MQFNSFSFIIFMLILMAILVVTKNRKARHIELLVASYIFYGFWDVRFCILMFLLTFITYVSGTRIMKKKSKLWLAIGVLIPLGILGVFKYFEFFLFQFMRVFGIHTVSTIKILLPVGISFYTFQAISYVVDSYRGDNLEGHNFIETALYISFFPQLVAGPIVKAKDFFPQLKEDRNITLKNIEAGLQYFVLGLFKKIVIADRISLFVEEVYDNPAMFSASTIVLAVIAYSVQIYCDFSGYSDMAIGCAKCIGYDLKKNFNIPYISKNVQEFWRRWHISLSTWLKEYLYIPLGGNRKGKILTYINLLITMILGGLWHGASWNFVIWGALQGVALCLHRLYRSLIPKKEIEAKSLRILLDGIKILITFAFISITWIFFRSSSLNGALNIIKLILSGNAGIVHNYDYAFIGIAFVIVEAILKKLFEKRISCKDGYEVKAVLRFDTVLGLFILFTSIGLTLGLAYISSNPFIYFQF